MKLSVYLVNAPRDEAALDHLGETLDPDIQLAIGPELPAPTDYHILVTGRPQRKEITASPSLRALVIPWAGLPESTRELMREFPGIAVHNLHHNALPVAEHIIALLMAATKSIVPMDRSLRSHDWRPRYGAKPSLTLAGKTALVLGYGAIGKHVARLCQGLGMEVIAIRRRASSLPTENARICCAPVEDLVNLLPRADALLVCLPHTPETDGLLGAKELALMPATAVLVNIGRGPIVDEAALYHALHEKRLYAAGLDVWYNYPADEAARACTPPSVFPFHKLDNVVMSPHRAGHSTVTEMLRMTHLAELLNAAAQGEAMPNRVDLDTGY